VPAGGAARVRAALESANNAGVENTDGDYGRRSVPSAAGGRAAGEWRGSAG